MDRTPFLDQQSSVPLYVQLYEYFKGEIENQSLKANSKLPSIRQLALHLKVSRNTVETAYQQLIAEGYVESKPKSGLKVLEMEAFHQQSKSKNKRSEKSSNKPASSFIDFQYGDIDIEKFPLREWRKCVLNAVDYSNTTLFTYGEKQGHFGLREEIADYLFQARGVECEPNEIVLCSGTQQAILLICQLLGLYQQKVAIENPGYDGVRAVFQKHQCHLVPLSLEGDGVNLNDIENCQAKAMYLTPSHQFPLGMVLSISKRIKLLQWAVKNNSYVIEDDYDSEFRYQGQPIPSLKSLDHQDRVIYVGTFSKAFLPATRVSYLVLPKDLVERYKEHFFYLHQSVSPIIQEALYQFMKSGQFAKHIRKMRKTYQMKHKKIIDCLEMYFGDRVTIIGQKAGLHLLLKVKNLEVHDLIEMAIQAGIKVYPTQSFWLEPNNGENIVMLGYGGLSLEAIDEGIKKLNSAWFG